MKVWPSLLGSSPLAARPLRSVLAWDRSVALIMHQRLARIAHESRRHDWSRKTGRLSIVTPKNSREFHEGLAVLRLPRQYPVEQLLQAIGGLRRPGASLRQLTADFGGA